MEHKDYPVCSSVQCRDAYCILFFHDIETPGFILFSSDARKYNCSELRRIARNCEQSCASRRTLRLRAPYMSRMFDAREVYVIWSRFILIKQARYMLERVLLFLFRYCASCFRIQIHGMPPSNGLPLSLPDKFQLQHQGSRLSFLITESAVSTQDVASARSGIFLTTQSIAYVYPSTPQPTYELSHRLVQFSRCNHT